MPVELSTVAIPNVNRSQISAATPIYLPILVETEGKKSEDSRPVKGAERLFSEALLETSTTRQPNSAKKLLLSVSIHVLILVALILVPLYFTDTLNLKQFTQTMLVAPPPPPPPPPAAQQIVRSLTPKRVFVNAGKLIAPTVIPSRVAMLKEAPLDPDLGSGLTGGVPGGVAGGQLGGVIGGIVAEAHSVPRPPVAKSAQSGTPLRVGGRVRAPKNLLKVQPAYPPLARQSHIQGNVLIDAVIDTDGNVVEMNLVSGHPLLVPAALEAVRHWKYEPTYLNDQAVPVQLIVTVTFQLGGGSPY